MPVIICTITVLPRARQRGRKSTIVDREILPTRCTALTCRRLLRMSDEIDVPSARARHLLKSQITTPWKLAKSTSQRSAVVSRSTNAGDVGEIARHCALVVFHLDGPFWTPPNILHSPGSSAPPALIIRADGSPYPRDPSAPEVVAGQRPSPCTCDDFKVRVRVCTGAVIPIFTHCHFYDAAGQLTPRSGPWDNDTGASVL